MNYLLDANIIIIYSRKGALTTAIENKYQLLSGRNRLYLSVVSLGEIDAYIKKFKIGKKRQRVIQETIKLTY
ncbi:MAG: hypothetical protein AAGJ18_12855 [Bacteroidota bacterium]